MTNTKKISQLAAMAGALCLLSACNSDHRGNNSSGTPAPTPTPTVTGFSTGSSGSAGKGIVVGGAVEAFEITASGLASRGTGTTGSDGAFAVALSSYTGLPILFRVSGGGTATMKCDLRAGCRDAAGMPVAFASSFALPGGFVMEGISPGVSRADAAKGVPACVSPFTHLAASRARELAGGRVENISADNANRAITEMRLLTGGVDVASLCVVDLTDPDKVANASPEALAHSLLSAATLAVTPDLSPAAALAGLASAFANGKIAATDTDAAKIALDDLVQAAQAEATANAIPLPANIQLVAMNVQQASSGDNVVQPCATEPCGGSPAQATASEKARTVFGELRSLYRNTEKELTDPARAFGEQLKAAKLASDPGSRQLDDGLSQGLSAAAKFYTQGNMTAGSTTLSTTDAAGSAKSAQISVSNNADGSDEIVVQGDVRDARLDLAMTLPHDPQASSTLNAKLVGSAQSAGSAGVKLSVSNASVTLTTVLNSEGDSVPDQLAVEGQAVFAQFGVSNPVSVEGALSLAVLRCTACGFGNLDLHFNPQVVSIFGKLSNDGNSSSVGARFDVDTKSARRFDPSLPYSASNFVKGSLSVSAALSLSGTAPYSAVVALNSTGFDAAKGEATGNFNVKLARADRLYDIVVPLSLPPDFNTATLTDRTASLTITTANNVVIAINDIPTDDQKPITGSILVDGVEAASIAETDSGAVLIRYKDGVIESLY